MGPVQAIGRSFRNYANSAGRAGPSEFWWFYAFTVVVICGTYLVLGLAASFASTTAQGVALGFASAVLTTIVLVTPLFSVWARRLHDMGQSAWWLLFIVIGLSIVPFIMALFPSQPHENQYGPGPEGVYPPAPQWDPHQQYPGQQYSGVAQAQSPYPAPPVQAPPAQPQAQYPQPPAPPQH